MLTSQEDYGFSLLLAMDPRSDDELIEKMESYFRSFKGLFSGDGLQSLTHVMTLAGENSTPERVRGIYRGLREKGLKYGKHYELSMLGVLAGLPLSVEEIVEEMVEADRYLKPRKGYGFWGLSHKERLMHAAMLVAAEHKGADDPTAMDTALLSGTIAMIAAEQAMLSAIIAANAASASAAAS